MNLVKIPNILLPKNFIDYEKWSCIACDQFSSQAEYWAELAKFVGDSPSALNLILPEAYLGKNEDVKISKINKTMQKYLEDNIFEEHNCFVLVKRTLASGKTRLGLMIEIDLEQYEYSDKNNAFVKATEKTVTERLPARINIRKNAYLELPHIMVLVDDESGDIIEKIADDKDNLSPLYDFDLNVNGGHIAGYKVNNSKQIAKSLNALTDKDFVKKKYNSDGNLAFVVGDGNHSLATAKECWNLIKQNLSEEQRATHPARYSLVELVNIYDKSIEFEPIHRLLLGAGADFVQTMIAAFEASNFKECSYVKLVHNREEYNIPVSCNPSDAIKDIQDFIDEYKNTHSEIELDYIHGDNALLELANKHNAVGILMPTIEKNGLFDYCFRRGALPRKSFSIGNAEDKRYYLECKKIK